MSESRVSEILEAIESDWLVDQVEGHLIFGPVSERFRIFPVVTVCYGLFFLVNLALYRSLDMTMVYTIAALVAITLVFAGATTLQQAIFGWAVAKLMTGFVGVIMLLLGPINLLKGKADWWMMLILGLIWCPGPEFHPEVAPYQKVITILRIVLTLPVIFLAWHKGVLFQSL